MCTLKLKKNLFIFCLFFSNFACDPQIEKTQRSEDEVLSTPSDPEASLNDSEAPENLVREALERAERKLVSQREEISERMTLNSPDDIVLNLESELRMERNSMDSITSSSEIPLSLTSEFLLFKEALVSQREEISERMTLNPPDDISLDLNECIRVFYDLENFSPPQQGLHYLGNLKRQLYPNCHAMSVNDTGTYSLVIFDESLNNIDRQRAGSIATSIANTIPMSRLVDALACEYGHQLYEESSQRYSRDWDNTPNDESWNRTAHILEFTETMKNELRSLAQSIEIFQCIITVNRRQTGTRQMEFSEFLTNIRIPQIERAADNWIDAARVRLR